MVGQKPDTQHAALDTQHPTPDTQHPTPDTRTHHRRICPLCGLRNASRARRRNPREYLISLVGIRPYYCQECEYRFHAFRAPRLRIHISPWARCPKCHSPAVEPVSKNRVPHSWGNSVWRMLDIPSYRCSPCRVKFFSIRPLKQFAGQENESGKHVPSQKGEHRSHSSRASRRRMPIFSWARCPNCRTTAIEPVLKENAPRSWRNYLWRLLQVPVYRCPACREKFFSIRPRRQVASR